MLTIKEIISDVERGCLANNIVEEKFLYHISYCIKRGEVRKKQYCTADFRGMQQAIAEIIKKNLTLENDIVITDISTNKGAEKIRLLRRSYPFSLEKYFEIIEGRANNGKINRY